MGNVILIDDQQEFTDSFVNTANTKGIRVSAYNSLEGLKQILPKFEHKFAAVVLDIKCLISNNQAKEHSSFITAALSYLDTHVSGFPRFILTGDETEFDKLKPYYPEEKMFIKSPDDQEKLFGLLEVCIQNAEPLRIRRTNLAIFEAFDLGLLPVGMELTVINILLSYNEKNPANFSGIITNIRTVHEQIYKSLNQRNKNVAPNRYFNGNGSPKFGKQFYIHLTGTLDIRNNYVPTTTPYQDSTINSATNFIHSACSEFIHQTSNTGYQISPYIIKSLINCLMEIIIWSKQY